MNLEMLKMYKVHIHAAQQVQTTVALCTHVSCSGWGPVDNAAVIFLIILSTYLHNRRCQLILVLFAWYFQLPSSITQVIICG